MRLGVRWKAGWGLLFLLGCASAGTGTGTRTRTEGRGATAESQTPAGPTCPVSQLLGDEPGASPGKPGAWHPGLSTQELGLEPNEGREAFHQKLELASGPLDVVGLELGGPESLTGGARVLLARPESGGYCVPNHWMTYLPGKVGVSLAGSWTSQDKRMALLLLKLETAKVDGGPETRWVVIGTDGPSAWFALGSPTQHQLVVPSVAFFTQGKSVYLDIKQRYVTRLALGKDGRFIQPAPP